MNREKMYPRAADILGDFGLDHNKDIRRMSDDEKREFIESQAREFKVNSRDLVIQNRQFIIRLESVLRGKSNIRAFAVDLARSFEGAFTSKMDLFYQTCHLIDAAKVHILGKDAPTDISNTIMQKLAEEIVANMVVIPEDVVFAEAFADSIKVNPEMSWAYPKLFNLANLLRYKGETQRLALENNSTSIELVHKRIESDSNSTISEIINEVIKKIITSRKYELKSAIFEDGVFLGEDEVWMVSDMKFILEQTYKDNVNLLNGAQSPDRIFPNYLASFTLVDAEGATTPKVHLIKESQYVISGIASNTKPYINWELQADGELYIGSISVREIFAVHNASKLYDLIRLSMLMRFHDLTVPRYIYEQSKPLNFSKPENGSEPKTAEDELAQEALLALQRVKVLRQVSPQELEEYYDLDEDTKVEKITRETKIKREHEVIGHARILPPGFKPHPQARELALKRGVILADNETWVQKHNRGGKDSKLKHKVKKTKGEIFGGK